MADEKVKQILKQISQIAGEIAETASDVNRHSVSRKEITSAAGEGIISLVRGNKLLKTDFKNTAEILSSMLDKINEISGELTSNLGNFEEIISNINSIENILQTLKSDIENLKVTIDELRDATDDIFSLALNASIASSKYSSSSGVFDILADRLNEMSNYINQNLQGILDLVTPILNSIYDIVNNSSTVLIDINKGHESFMLFPEILKSQRVTVESIIEKASVSTGRLESEEVMLDKIARMTSQMDDDASAAISGSANVRRTGEELAAFADAVSARDVENHDIEKLSASGTAVKNSATAVNEKSMNQLEFSKESVGFCDLIVSESSQFTGLAEQFSALIEENNSLASNISERLTVLTGDLRHTEVRLNDSYKRIKLFNEEYEHIEQIIEFLKNILKSMNVIGMYSRIESSRDPDEFSGFITISDNIKKLQAHIHNNIPVIEGNITRTHQLIAGMNEFFEKISTTFILITISAESVIAAFNGIRQQSSESDEVNRRILSGSRDMNELLAGLRSRLVDLTEIVKKPIEGSALNMEKGARIELLCASILDTQK
jgi:methyl-accepting chemotaxis protein